MTRRNPPKNLVPSVKQRLLNHSRSEGIDPNLLFTRYALERYLYRLTHSPHSDRFILKGASLMLVWFGLGGRPTKDLDLLGSGVQSLEELEEIFREVCTQPVEPDGMLYLPETVKVAPIRENDEYGGNRVTLEGRMGNARLYLQIDVGIGDAVVPQAEWLEYPTLLDMPHPKLRAYRPETVIAEKLHAMVILDLVNSRMKDFYDILMLSRFRRFEGDFLVTAIQDTFTRRQTAIPQDTPIALKKDFGQHPDKQVQWRAFLNKNRLTLPAEELETVIEELALFLLPVLETARNDKTSPGVWMPGGPWQPRDIEEE